MGWGGKGRGVGEKGGHGGKLQFRLCNPRPYFAGSCAYRIQPKTWHFIGVSRDFFFLFFNTERSGSYGGMGQYQPVWNLQAFDMCLNEKKSNVDDPKRHGT